MRQWKLYFKIKTRMLSNWEEKTFAEINFEASSPHSFDSSTYFNKQRETSLPNLSFLQVLLSTKSHLYKRLYISPKAWMCEIAESMIMQNS